MSVELVGPDGREFTIDESELSAALSQGFKQRLAPLEEQKPDGVLEEIATAGMPIAEGAAAATFGAAEGVTGGLFGAALGSGRNTSEAAQEALRLRERNPVASTAGELAGMVVSPLNKAGELVRGGIGATTALGRIGAGAAEGATTGVLFGAGKTVSDASLGDTELTAEKLIAGAGLGAVLGAAGGGIGTAITEGARAVLPSVRTMASRAQSALDDIANDATIQATRAQQGVINRIGDDKLKAAAEAIRGRGLIRGSPDEMAKAISAEREKLGSVLGKFLDDADAAGSKADHMRMLNRLDDFEAKLNPLEKDAITGDLRAARKAVAKLGEEGSAFRALDDLKQTIQAKAKFSRGPVPLDDVTFGLRRQLAGVFRDELDQQLLPQLGSDAAKAFTESKAAYGALKDAERLAESGAGRVGERGSLSYVGLKDLLAGNILGGAGTPFGIAGALGMKVLREQGPAIAARIADKLAKEPALAAIAKSFAASLPEVAPKLGPYAAALAQEARISPERALAMHIASAQLDPSYAATAQLAGLTPELPDEHPAAMARARTLADAQAVSRAHDDAVRKGVERVVRGEGSGAAGVGHTQDFGAMRMRRAPGDGFDKRVAEIRELATNPEALIERVAGNMSAVGQTAPALMGAMTATAARAVAYLAQQAEVPPKAGPLAPEWEAPEADKFAFMQRLEVIQEPMSVLDSAAAGMLTEEQIEALHAVYPKLARQIADTALERMVSGKGDIPYQSKLMLSLLSGVDPDGTLSAEAIAANQAAIVAAGKSREVAPVAPVGPDRAGDVSIAQRTAMPSQRREVQLERQQE